MRTPLGQIICYSEILQEEMEDRGQEDLGQPVTARGREPVVGGLEGGDARALWWGTPRRGSRSVAVTPRANATRRIN